MRSCSSCCVGPLGVLNSGSWRRRESPAGPRRTDPRCFRLGRARRRDRLAVHRAVHGAALGYALTAAGATMLAVFVALASAGAPYVALAWFPGCGRACRVRPVLERMKQLLASAVATVIWLAWGARRAARQRRGAAALRRLLASASGFSGLAHRPRRGARPWGIAGSAALVAAALVASPLFLGSATARGAPRPSTTAGRRERLGRVHAGESPELTGAGRAVFVDFTAACASPGQVTSGSWLDTADVRAASRAPTFARVRADWTRRDPEIHACARRVGPTACGVRALPPGGAAAAAEVLRQGVSARRAGHAVSPSDPQ